MTYGIGHGIMALLRIWTVCFCLTPWSTLDSGKEVGAPAVRIRGLPQGVGDCSSISPLILGLPIQRLWAHSDVACLRQHQEWVMAPWPEKQKRDCREWLQQRQCQLPGCRSCQDAGAACLELVAGRSPPTATTNPPDSWARLQLDGGCSMPE